MGQDAILSLGQGIRGLFAYRFLRFYSFSQQIAQKLDVELDEARRFVSSLMRPPKVRTSTSTSTFSLPVQQRRIQRAVLAVFAVFSVIRPWFIAVLGHTPCRDSVFVQRACAHHCVGSALSLHFAIHHARNMVFVQRGVCAPLCVRGMAYTGLQAADAQEWRQEGPGPH